MLSTNQLPNKGILIAPAYMHSALRSAYLKKEQGIFNLSIVTLSTFLSTYHSETSDEIEILLLYLQRCNSLQCSIYHNLIHTLDFLKQCVSFIDQMKFYGIQVHDLPQATSAQKEMKDILCAVYDIPSKMDAIQSALHTISSISLQDVYIMDASYTYQEETIVKMLQNAQATRISFDEIRSSTAFYNAMNKRKEVEAMAQMIVAKKQKSEDINIVVCDNSYKALIAQVFHRYAIPHTIVKESSTSIITKRFILLLEYYLQPSVDILIELIQCNTFKAPYVHDLIEYLQLFHMQIDDVFTHVAQHGVVSELISSSEIKRLTSLEEHAQLAKDVLWEYLEPLHRPNTIQELFLHINKVASDTISIHNSKHIATLKQIHSLLKKIQPYISKKEELPFVIDVLSTIQESANKTQLQGAFITDSNAPLPPRDICYILGCTQSKYPAVPILRGLFDEAYVKEIQGYPSMRTRYEHHMLQLEHHHNVYDTLIVSYPLGGYDGKSNESALEMERFLAIPPLPYPLYEYYHKTTSQFHITPESAKALFVKEGVIPGSISSFERYIRCPFAYFLAYGLQLREPINNRFSPERIGTLAHYMLETFVNRYTFDYVNAPLEEVQALLQSELQNMAKLYPSFQIQVESTTKRMLHNIIKNLAYLKDMEAHAHMSAIESEHEFWWELPLQEDLTIRLHGFIDRIDTSSGFARIIDYKSSQKSLHENDVFAGLQLQLVTYALYVQEVLHKQLLGVYYYSLKPQNINMSAGNMKRRPIEFVPYAYSDYDILAHNSHRLQGWTMDDNVDIIDDDATHIYGVRQNKDGEIRVRKTYDLQVLKQHFVSMYQIIAKRILAGDISCSPSDDACMFCPYGDVCRYSGYPRVVEPLVDVDESIYKGGA